MHVFAAVSRNSEERGGGVTGLSLGYLSVEQELAMPETCELFLNFLVFLMK